MKPERPAISAAADTGSPQQPSDAQPFLPREEASRLDEQENFDTREALAHFRLLVEFVDKFLARQVLLRQQLKRGLEDKMAFEDLWMLFDAGANIYCPFHEGGILYGGHIPPRPSQREMDTHMTKAQHVPQIFRVLGTTGGLPLQGAFSPRGSIRNKSHGTVNGSAFSKAFLRNLTAATEPQNRSNDPSTIANLVEELLRGTTLETFSRLNVVVFHIDFNGIE